MFTLISQRKSLTPRTYYLHAANSASAVHNSHNQLNRRFSDAHIPEDQILCDAASRVLQQMHQVPDIEITRVFQMLQNLAIGADFVVPVGGQPPPTTPAAPTIGNLQDIQSRITPLNASLSALQAAFDELVEVGWTGTLLEEFGNAVAALRNQLPGIDIIGQSYRQLDSALNSFHRIADTHGGTYTLNRSDINHLDHDLQIVSAGMSFARTPAPAGLGIEAYMNYIETETRHVDVHTILERELARLRNTPAYRTLKDKPEFDRHFLLHFSQAYLERANTHLEATKVQVFQDRRGEFEGLVHQSRKMAMEHILELDPTNTVHLGDLHQIFVTNRRYFQRLGTIPDTAASTLAQNIVTQVVGLGTMIDTARHDWAVFTGPRPLLAVSLNNAIASAHALGVEITRLSGLLPTIPGVPANVINAVNAALIGVRAYYTNIQTLTVGSTDAQVAAVAGDLVTASVAVDGIVAVANNNLANVPQRNLDAEMQDQLVAVLNRYYPQVVAQAGGADIIAGAIMDQNAGENALYYGDSNPFRDLENHDGSQRLARGFGKAGEVIGGFFAHDKTKKGVKAFMKGLQKITEGIAGVTGKVLSKTADFVGNTVVSGATSGIHSGVSSVDAWAWKAREKGFFNTIGWLAKMPTRPLTKLAKVMTWTTDGLIGKGVGEGIISKGVDTIIIGGTNKAYNLMNESIKQFPDNDVDGAWTGLGWLARKTGEWTGRGIDWLGNSRYDQMKTTQKVGVLAGLRQLFDRAPQAALGYQAMMFRSTMRNWGAGTPVPPAPPAAPVAAPHANPLTDGEVIQVINVIRNAGHINIGDVLNNLSAELGNHPTTPRLQSAYQAAYDESIRRGTRARPAPTVSSVIQAALAAR